MDLGRLIPCLRAMVVRIDDSEGWQEWAGSGYETTQTMPRHMQLTLRRSDWNTQRCRDLTVRVAHDVVEGAETLGAESQRLQRSVNKYRCLLIGPRCHAWVSNVRLDIDKPTARPLSEIVDTRVDDNSMEPRGRDGLTTE